MPSISIITASYNAEKYIGQCIDSINQQDTEVEHVFVDGLSTDNTLDIINRKRSTNSLVISEPDKGIYDAMNKGINASSGDVIGILNADDFYPTNKTLSMVNEAFSDPEVMISYGDLLYIDEKGKVVRKWIAGNYSKRSFYWGWMPPHPTVFIRKSVYEKYGLFRLDLGSAADYELMLRMMLKYNLTAQYTPSTLVHMRTGGVSNASVINRIKANRMDRLAWTVNQLKPLPWTFYAKPARKLSQWF